MKKLFAILSMLLLLYGGSILFVSCELGGNAPEDVRRLVGTWEGHVERKDVEYILSFYEEDMRVTFTMVLLWPNVDGDNSLVLENTSWSVDGDVFYVGPYEGEILSDSRIVLKTNWGNPWETEEERTRIVFDKVSDMPGDTDATQEDPEEEPEEEVINDPEMVSRVLGLWERKDEANGEAVMLEFRESMHVSEHGYDANIYRTEREYKWETVNDRIRATELQTGFVNFWAELVGDGVMIVSSFGEVYTKLPEPVYNVPETIQSVIGVWQSADGDTFELNADMTYSENGVLSEFGVWRTCNDEVQLLLDEEFFDWSRTERYIISGDELICYPGFAESRRYHRVAGETANVDR